MRSIVANLNQPALELGCFALRLPILKKFASHVFFGRGSFPDVEARDSKFQTVEAARVSGQATFPMTKNRALRTYATPPNTRTSCANRLMEWNEIERPPP